MTLVRSMIGPLAAALAVYAGARVGMILGIVSQGLTPLWPANALLLVFLLRLPARRWPPYVIAGLLANFAAVWPTTGMTDAAVGLPVCNSIEAIGAAWCLRSWCGKRPLDLTMVGHLARFVLLCGVIWPAVSGTLAATVLVATRPVGFGEVWIVWFGARALGAILVATPFLALNRPEIHRLRATASTLEIVALTCLVVMSALVVFGQNGFPLLFMILPAQVLVALRLGFFPAAAATLLTGAMAIVFTVNGQGPLSLISGASLAERLLFLQVFLVVTLFTILPIPIAATKRNSAELALAESEEMFKLLVNGVREYAIYALDPIGHVKSWNLGAERIKAYRAEEILGRHYRTFFTPEDIAKGEPERGLRIAAETGSFEAEGWRVRKDGSQLWAHVSVAVLRGRYGELIGYSKVTRDYTEQRAAETALIAAKVAAEAASRAKSEFLAGMSHEIRTPLNGVIGFATLLLDSTLDAEQRRQATLLKDAGTSLLAILNDVLDLSKIEAGKLELETMPLSPAGVAKAAVEIVRPAAAAKRLSLVLDIADDVPAWVAGDPARLRQILLNLMNNAVKFTEHGQVRLEVRNDGGPKRTLLRFEVSDTGIGIPADRQDRLFQNFSQVDQSTSRRFGGTGLGLAISKRLTEAMGGEIGVRSEPGAGSTFWFTVHLPRTNAPLAKSAGDTRPSDAPSARILVAEDILTNQILVKAMLEKAGHVVTIAGNGAQAVSAFQAAPFDLVFMDMEMPEMDGATATRRIRELEAGARRIPIVALSANAMPDEVERCRSAGMDDHLAKPINMDALLAVVSEWTSRAPAAEPNPEEAALDA